ncbi:hypothetical protein F5X68DRAFT_246030 [Plectosphaerella plurivora]|uniref:Tri14-like protein n=1 Tax=Plectosphaerella plurivora TaxID=936078 RepID=A0A9P8V617_9PEZI|nr:hypothetical protein F5X68DRAFT_246030 [Plectosphaerella plurivora]
MSSLFTAAIAGLALHTRACSSITGTRTIDSFQLYPENGDFDPKRCVGYLSVLYNSTVAVYDPGANRVDRIIEIPGLSYDPLLHSSGVKLDGPDKLSIVINAGRAFETGGQNRTGENFLVKYDLAQDKILWQANLGVATNNAVTGYQDVEHDGQGNSYVVSSFPESIVRVSADGQSVTPWYVLAEGQQSTGMSGLAKFDDKMVLATNVSGSSITAWDLTQDTGVPRSVPVTGLPANETLFMLSDGLYLPPRYEKTILLIADGVKNGVAVVRSNDGWASAQYLGFVANPVPEGGSLAAASVQLGDNVFLIPAFFTMERVAGTLAGPQSAFPLPDITAEVEALVNVKAAGC